MMFVNDHLQNFPYSNMPAFCVGLAGSYDAPSPGGARLMRLPPRKVPGAPEWGMALLETGLQPASTSRTPTRSRAGTSCRSPCTSSCRTATPRRAALHQLRGASASDPQALPRPGAFVGSFIRSRPAAERIAVLATGGLSHWVGTPETGRINPEWDQWVLDHVARADVDALLRLTPAEIERDGGNGGQEIRNWIALLAALPGWKGEVLAYEPGPEWITGCATVWVHR